MKVQLEKAFPLPASPEAAWTVLQDIEAVAGCMPGARITERVDEQHYKGTVQVKLGPASLSFRGEIEVLALDPSARSLRLRGKGTDTSGTSGAAMDLSARIDPAVGGTSSLVGASEVSLSGKAATFGSRLIGPVSEQVLQQFAGNFAARAQQVQAALPPVPVVAAAPLSAFAVLWAAVRDWLRGLFGMRRA